MIENSSVTVRDDATGTEHRFHDGTDAYGWSCGTKAPDTRSASRYSTDDCRCSCSGRERTPGPQNSSWTDGLVNGHSPGTSGQLSRSSSSTQRDDDMTKQKFSLGQLLATPGALKNCGKAVRLR
jgi:hypothetical protein